ncbi:hypothetical protein GCM10010308_17320 [Streptomyces vinaceusdrappus]|nr:hypothetical protein GCM10010308_17320 [Streptomyces vinaceusdrappus]
MSAGSAREGPPLDPDRVPAGRVADRVHRLVPVTACAAGPFPETSPCHGIRATPVSRYLPPDSFCRHADGEWRTVNGPDAKFLFWAAACTTVAMPIAAVRARRRAVGRAADGS